MGPTIFDDALPAAYQYRNLLFQALHRQNELEFLVHVDWYPPYSSHTASLRASTYQNLLFFDGNPDEPAYDPVYYGRQVLDLGKALYAVTSPKFGWADHGPPEMSPSDEQLSTFRIFDYAEGPYWANFFSPAFVERIGATRLANAPFGWTETLSDGGLLYVFAPTCFGGDLMGTDGKQIKRYFGL